MVPHIDDKRYFFCYFIDLNYNYSTIEKNSCLKRFFENLL